jgi:tRNA threonylcarbamoyl adenosine modification protein YeaZ
LLLSIDTTAGTSASVFRGECLSFVSFENPFGHAENIGEAIAKAMLDAGVQAGELLGIAVARGPAPYTGLRVGMAAATSLAKALGLPLYGVITLDAVAHGNSAEKLLVVSDAKRGELFAATYHLGERQAGPMLLSPAHFAEYAGYEILQQSSTAQLVGRYAEHALQLGESLSDLSALYLRSPDVTLATGKKVSG